MSSIWKEFDKVYMGHTATIEIDDVVKLLEKKNILIIDKLNAVCLYEQRLNFIASKTLN